MLQDVRCHNLPRQVAPFELPAPKSHCLNDNETILNPALSPRKRKWTLGTCTGNGLLVKLVRLLELSFASVPWLFKVNYVQYYLKLNLVTYSFMTGKWHG